MQSNKEQAEAELQRLHVNIQQALSVAIMRGLHPLLAATELIGFGAAMATDMGGDAATEYLQSIVNVGAASEAGREAALNAFIEASDKMFDRANDRFASVGNAVRDAQSFLSELVASARGGE